MADPQDPATESHLGHADRLTPADHVLASRVGSDLVLLDVKSGRYYGLDPVGTTIFEMLREGLSVGAVHTRLVQTYDCHPRTLWTDLDEFSQQMLALGLFRRLA
jgi:hypothetical protein